MYSSIPYGPLRPHPDDMSHAPTYPGSEAGTRRAVHTGREQAATFATMRCLKPYLITSRTSYATLFPMNIERPEGMAVLETMVLVRQPERRWQQIAVSVALGIWVYGCIIYNFTSIGRSIASLCYPWSDLIEQYYEPATIAILLVVIAWRVPRAKMLTAALLAGMIAILYLSYTLCSSMFPMMLLLFLLASVGMDIPKLCRVFFWVSLAALVTIVACDASGIAWFIWTMPKPKEYMCGFAFGTANEFGTFATSIISALVMGFDRKRLGIPLLAACVGGTVFCWYALNYRTGVIVLGLLAVLLITERFIPGLVKLVETPRFFTASLIVALVGFFLLTFAGSGPFLETPFGQFLDDLVSGRVHIVRDGFETLGGLSLFGRPVIFTTGAVDPSLTNAIYPIDNAYARYPIVDGVAMLACYLALFVNTVIQMGRHKHDYLAWVLIGLSLLTFYMETAPTFLFLNCRLLYLTYGLSFQFGGAGESTLPEKTAQPVMLVPPAQPAHAVQAAVQPTQPVQPAPAVQAAPAAQPAQPTRTVFQPMQPAPMVQPDPEDDAFPTPPKKGPAPKHFRTS